MLLSAALETDLNGKGLIDWYSACWDRLLYYTKGMEERCKARLIFFSAHWRKLRAMIHGIEIIVFQSQSNGKCTSAVIPRSDLASCIADLVMQEGPVLMMTNDESSWGMDNMASRQIRNVWSKILSRHWVHVEHFIRNWDLFSKW